MPAAELRQLRRTPPSDRMRLIAWLRDVALLCSDEDLAAKAQREYIALTGRRPVLTVEPHHPTAS